MEERDEKKGFTIRDRRGSSPQGETAHGESGRIEESPKSQPLPEIDFSSFIFSLSTSALLHLGEVPDPVTQKREKDLPLAKQTIDILGVLKEKTRGNLTPAEEGLMENILTDLRWRYIREAKE
ncbi:MAG: DUF1844 domain-containing protein [Pseudomonadota bacterium]